MKLISSNYYVTWPLLFSTVDISVQIQLFEEFSSSESLLTHINSTLVDISANIRVTSSTPGIKKATCSGNKVKITPVYS